MTTYLFAGPSLPDAAGLLAGDDVTVLPPVGAGDLLKLAPKQGDVVGIIDGYFRQTRAVRHKEILALIESGVTVVGAASMGALRAAELDTFGMRGVGRVYRDYRHGRLTADDEVALLHGPPEDGYRPITEALVNIRATLRLCVRDGILDEGAAADLAAELARRPYRLRSYPALIELARALGAEKLEALRQVCTTRPVNLKRDDALELIAELRTIRPGPEPASFTLARSIYLHRWQLGARDLDTEDGPIPELSILRMCQLFAEDYPDFYRNLVYTHIVQECTDQPPQPTLDAALAHARHRTIIPETPDELDFLDLWLTPAERDQPLREQLAAFLIRSFQLAPGAPADALALDALRGRPIMSAAANLVHAARTVNQHAQQTQSTFDIHTLSADRILNLIGERWGADPETLELHALDRGIPSRDTLIAAARPFYLLATYNPHLMDLRIG
ncbi:TfuA-like protein [Nonomuraea sp. NPDC049504]|uniref:TfuA-like protein n=1 Tax=Nonomuraea sp. NPDC049504 TaxID=3154729 RepID=UPI0034399481